MRHLQIIKEPNYGRSPIDFGLTTCIHYLRDASEETLKVNGTCSPSKNPVGMYYALLQVRVFVDFNGDPVSKQESRTEKFL
jgi:hypothetical protein